MHFRLKGLTDLTMIDVCSVRGRAASALTLERSPDSLKTREKYLDDK